MPLTVRIDPRAEPSKEDEPTVARRRVSALDDDDTTTTTSTSIDAPQPFAPSQSSPPPAPKATSPRPSRQRCPACDHVFSGDVRFCPFDGDALLAAPERSPSSDPLIGKILEGRYQVLGVVGEGGMGTVYEVVHTTLGRKFALKVLRRDMADAELTARFIQEAKAAAAIGHPNIVQVSDFGELVVGEGTREAAKVPYFVMERLSGVSLAQLLRAEPTLEGDRVAAIVAQCARGLAAAHKAGVIHRDLKPDNVFLVRQGEREWVKLLDFGVAKIMGGGKLTRAGMVFGTPHYMSPEQAAGNPIDHRADVYALGVILYECLAGRLPFEADTYMGVLTKHMFATPEPIEAVAPPNARLGALGPIVMKCLAKTPSDRFADMTELAVALEGAIANPTEAAALSIAGPPSDRLHLRSNDDRFEGRLRLSSPGVPTRPLISRSGFVAGAVIAALAIALFVVVRASDHHAAAAPLPPTATAIATATAPATATATATASATATATASASPLVVAPTSRPRLPRPTKPPPPQQHGDIVNPWAN